MPDTRTPSPGDQAERIDPSLTTALPRSVRLALNAYKAKQWKAGRSSAHDDGADGFDAAAEFRALERSIAAALQPASPDAAPGSDAPAGQPLWCVHVRGPDDVVPVASYDDAVRMADGLNWSWLSLPYFTENDPIMSAIPAPWNGTPEEHAGDLTKLGTTGYYGIPTQGLVNKWRNAAFALRVERSRAASAGQEGGLPAGWVAVPREPTEEMLAAADTAMVDTVETDNWLRHAKNAWNAMLAAAPEPLAAVGKANVGSDVGGLRRALKMMRDLARDADEHGLTARGFSGELTRILERAIRDDVFTDRAATPRQARPSRGEVAAAVYGSSAPPHDDTHMVWAAADRVIALLDAPSAAGRDVDLNNGETK